MTGPVHLLADVGDRRSLCGVEDPLPHLVARFVADHIEGHARHGRTFIPCPACVQAQWAAAARAAVT